MRNFALALVAVVSLASTACQSAAPRAASSRGNAGATGLVAIGGEYDNHAERWRAKDAAATAAPAPAMHHWIRVARDSPVTLLWRIAQGGATPSLESRWLFREEDGALVPYRPITAAALASFDAAAGTRFSFETADWARLSPCAMTRGRDALSYAADAKTCSAVLPGLGEAAALLPLHWQLDGEHLRVTTVSDQARGTAAATDALRVHWFTGWSAINGAGPKAVADSSDWHLRRDLRLHSEGARLPMTWRDGNASGYTLELSRLHYRESGSEILRLAVIDDKTGAVVSYAWADPDARRIGLNVGWLQAGFEREDATAATKP